MKKNTKIIIGTLIGFTIVSQLWKHYWLEKNTSIETIVETLNKDCPIIIDSNNLVFRYDYLPPDTMVLNYQLTNELKETLDVEASKKAFEPILRKYLKKEIDAKKIVSTNFISVYKYYDKNRDFLFEIIISFKERTK